MKKILLIRHGETQWNYERRIQGLKNIPLSKNGMQDAEKLALFMGSKFEVINNIYSSDLKRAYQTAIPIAKIYQKNIITRKELREQSFGKFEGRILDELSPKELDEFRSLKKNSEYSIPKSENDAEPFVKFKDRIIKEINKIIENTLDNEISVIVTHGGVINIALSNLFQTSQGFDNFYGIKNTSISEFSIMNNEIVMDSFNENSFLNA